MLDYDGQWTEVCANQTDGGPSCTSNCYSQVKEGL